MLPVGHTYKCSVTCQLYVVHANVVLPVRRTYKCGVICLMYIQVRCYLLDVHTNVVLPVSCMLYIHVVLPVRHTGMGIVCKNANFCFSETDFLRREKIVRREKKLGVQKTKTTTGSADFSSTHVAVLDLDCTHRRT